MKSRPPIVVILGHVDHGKTTLLDYIRKSRIANKEHGGITQRIGAYEIETNIKGYETNKITFIDTPGHEAFSKLRARGANIADIAILVIDAKDSVKPQTIECISHIKSSNIPFIVALNKIDLPDINLEKVKNDLLKHEVATEDKGGKVPVLAISAKTGKGINDLLESILLVSSDLKLKYDINALSESYIIETKKDKGGIAVSMVIKNGKLAIGDIIYTKENKAKIRSMINDVGKQLKQVIPSTPFEMLGFNELPAVGSKITNKQEILKEKEEDKYEERKINMDELLGQDQKKEKKLSLIIKANSLGSLDAIISSLKSNPNIEIILGAVGNINKSDVFLAKTTKSIIIGFASNYSFEIGELAKQEKIIIKSYNIIYELLEELNEVAKVIKEKEQSEKSLKGEAKILASFVIEGEKIYGIKVIKGKINLNDELQIYRQNNLLGKTKLISLKQRAKSVKEVKKDQEAGILTNPQLDFRVGDVIKCIL